MLLGIVYTHGVNSNRYRCREAATLSTQLTEALTVGWQRENGSGKVAVGENLRDALADSLCEAIMLLILT